MHPSLSQGQPAKKKQRQQHWSPDRVKHQRAKEEKKQDKEQAEKEQKRIDALKQKLVECWNFTNHQFAESFAKNGVAEALFEFVETGGKISDEDPLLVVNVDKSHADSIGYFNEGNYGIAAVTPGHMAGGVPQRGIAGPHALATLLNQQPGLTSRSGDKGGILFYAQTWPDVINASHALFRTSQFSRKGPCLAAAAGVNVEAPLVEFYTLEKVNSQPVHYANFNWP